jgi:cell division protein FtsW
VPLPFVSFGGSALIVSLTGIGVLASIARESGAAGRRKARKAGP